MFSKKSQLQKVKTRTILSVPQLKKAVQREVNKYIRLRDSGKPCISCQKPIFKGDAGHYVAQGSSGYLRYNLDNLNLQCQSCNRFKHGNLLEYRIGLIEKLGIDKVEYLEEHRKVVKKWTRDELLEIREKTKLLVETLKENV